MEKEISVQELDAALDLVIDCIKKANNWGECVREFEDKERD